MTTNIATSVMTKYPNRGETIALTDLEARGATEYLLVSRVYWADGGWSYGKSWFFPDEPQWGDLKGTLLRVGAGSSGDMIVWEHPAYAAYYVERNARLAAKIGNTQ